MPESTLLSYQEVAYFITVLAQELLLSVSLGVHQQTNCCY